MLKNEKNKGITLIALVVTAIVLLILAAVSIQMLTGDNGIITNASKVSTSNAYYSAEEQVKLAYMAVKAEISAKTVKSGTYDPTGSAETTALATIVENDLGANQTGSKWAVTSSAGTIKITYTDPKIDKGVAGVVDGVAVPKEEGKVEYKIILHKSQDATLYTDTVGMRLASEIVAEAESQTTATKKVEYYQSLYEKVVDYPVQITTSATSGSGANKGQWKIFYADENNIYLIADSRVEVPYYETPTETNKNEFLSGYITTSRWTAQFGSTAGNGTTTTGDGIFPKYMLISSSNKIVDYNRTTPTQITKYASEQTLKKLNNSYYSQEFGKHSTGGGNEHSRAVASMLDTDVWSIYMDNNYAEYAIGGPSVEMFCNSYTQTHAEGAGLEAKAFAPESGVTNQYGYKVKTTATASSNSGSDYGYNTAGGTVVAYSANNTSTEINKLYRPNNSEPFWLSSPSAINASSVMHVDCNSGNVSSNNYYNYAYYGFRPLVCLKSDVQLVEASQAKKDQGIDFELR